MDTSVYLNFRQLLERSTLSGAAGAFIASYLSDFREPNHCSLPELLAYAKPDDHEGAREAWALFESHEAVCRRRGFRFEESK